MFKGSMPALVTPFRNGAVDEAAFVALVERQIVGGAGALVPCGTTGESSTLTHDEHRRVIELCVLAARGRLPVIAGTGSNATEEAIGLTAFAKEIGCDAALVVSPYYVRPTQEGIYRHFKAIADAVQLPVFVYNVPTRTSSDIAPETLGRLAELPNIVGIKDATGDMDRVARHTALCGADFVLLSGDDPSALGFNAHGGVGMISVSANVAPEACARLQAATLRGDFAEARRIDRSLSRLNRALFLEASPSPTKYALSLLGLCSEEVRLPLVPVQSDAVKAEITASMREAGVL